MSIKVTVLYMDGTAQDIIGESFQHGERTLSIKTNRESFVAIPCQIIRAYEVSRNVPDKTTEPLDGTAEIEGPREDQGDTGQTKEAPEEKETS